MKALVQMIAAVAIVAGLAACNPSNPCPPNTPECRQPVTGPTYAPVPAAAP